jgi:hypothetical protein
MKVLQAVREQVTSNDLECSAVAADCLAQYLEALSSNKRGARNNTDQQKQTTASWAMVLLGRLDDCRKALQLQQQQQQQQSSIGKLSKNQQKKAEKTKKQWYAVAAPCFIALCQLIEDNGYALDQINRQKKTFVEVVFGILSLGCDRQPFPPKVATGDDTTMNDAGSGEAVALQNSHDAVFAKLRDTTALYSARCLHSALDDNWELAEALDGGDDHRELWKNLLGGTTEGNGKHHLSSMTRLHLIGCLVNLYQLSDPRSTNAMSWQEEAILEYGIRPSSSSGSSEGLLLEVLLSSHSSSLLQTRLSEIDAKYRAAQTLLEKQQLDQKLEEDVETRVKERKEPAKLIARRQKKVKEAKREAFREQQKAKMIAMAESCNDTDMMNASDEDEDDDEDKNDKAEAPGTITRERDGEEARNEAHLEWTDTTGPIQLGLEILTNLVSTWISPPGGSEDGDDPMGGFRGGRPGSSNLVRLLQSQQMASRLVETLQSLSQFLRKSPATQSSDDPIRNDAEETVDKVSACVINCFLSGVIDAQKEGPLLWESTLSSLRTELAAQHPSTTVLDACSSVLAVAVQVNQDILRSCLRGGNCNGHISLFQQLLPRADAVCLLSSVILLETSEVPCEATIRSLTEGFLALLRAPATDLKTQTAVLKAFMDWFGNDGFHPRLYESLCVSETIRAFLDSLAKRQDNLDLDEEQLQILHNSERFIDYKNQLRLRLDER